MKILFDQGTPVPLRGHLHPRAIDTAAERGWSTLMNGDLISQAEVEGYEVFITTDQNLKYQKIWTLDKFASWPRIQKHIVKVRQALDQLPVGEYVEVDVS